MPGVCHPDPDLRSQLGNGANSNSSLPVAVSTAGFGAGEKITRLASGPTASHSLVIAAVPLAADSTLTGLAVDTATLSPVFAAGTTTYTANTTTGSIKLTPITSHPRASVTVNGMTVPSGTQSPAIALAAGDNVVTVVVTAENGTRTTYIVTITRANSYEAWLESAFPMQADRENPGVSGRLATPANDGISNLMKYALALAPKNPGTTLLPYTGEHDGYMTLTYRKNKHATNFTYIVQASGTLLENDWIQASSVVSTIDAGDHWLVTVQDNVPQAGHTCRFMRLKVAD